MQKIKALLFYLIVSLPFQSIGQSDSSSTYYESYTSKLTTRLYTVTKFNTVQFNDRRSSDFIAYSPNTNLNAGFGFNYRGLGLNFGFRIPALNQDDDKYGVTRHLNWDASLYLKKFTALTFLEIYNGYYRSDNDKKRPVIPKSESLGIRSDLRYTHVGVSGTYVFNYRKFSYRASYTQDAWQKKSSGSFLLGGFLTYAYLLGDSNFVGADVSKNFESIEFREFSSFDFGPMIGYIHTFVLKSHWFFTLSLNTGVGINQSYTRSDDNSEVQYNDNFNTRLHTRLAFGYNSRRNFVGFTFYNEINNVEETDYIYAYSSGQVRLNLVHRFDVKGLGFVDKLMDLVPGLFLPKNYDGEAH